MQSSMEGDFVVAKLDDGEGLFPSIERLIEHYGISSGLIVSGMGMLRDFELNFFKDGQYKKERYSTAMELVAMHGSIAEDRSIHIHCAVAGEDHIVRGGHLTSASVAVLNELVIRKLNKVKITRVFNERTQLKETSVA